MIEHPAKVTVGELGLRESLQKTNGLLASETASIFTRMSSPEFYVFIHSPSKFPT
jgi:hypothetical protein